MAVTVKKARLWRKELDNRPGTLSKALQPLAAAGVNLTTVMGYRFPGDEDHAAVEVFPVEGKKAEDAARKGGLMPFGDVSCLLVSGDDRPGIGARISQALAEAGINICFVMTLVAGKKYVSIMGFSERDADKAIPLIKRANLSVAAGKKAAKGKRTVKKAGKAAQRKATTKAKPGAKKATAKRAGAKKAGAKKTAAKKSTAKKSTAKKATSKKSAAKKPGGKAKSKRR